MSELLNEDSARIELKCEIVKIMMKFTEVYAAPNSPVYPKCNKILIDTLEECLTEAKGKDSHKSRELDLDVIKSYLKEDIRIAEEYKKFLKEKRTPQFRFGENVTYEYLHFFNLGFQKALKQVLAFLGEE